MTTPHQAALAVRVAVGRRIRERRKQLEMTQIELAKVVGVGNSVLSEWERGRSGVPKEKLVKIAAALQSAVIDFTNPIRIREDML